MKLKNIVPLILCVSMLFSVTACQNKESNEELAESLSNVAKADAILSNDFTSTQMEFALNLFKAVNKTSADKNVVLSPLSISTAIGMTYFCAQGETADEISQVLNLESLDDLTIASGYKHIAASFDKSIHTIVDNANSIWVDEDYPIKQGFVDTMEGAFLSETKSIDLQGDDAVDTVNNWVKKNTGNMIDTLFTNPFDPLTEVVLVNAIYFDGKWTTPFDSKMSLSGEFNGQSGVSEATMMYRNDTVLGKDSKGYRAIYLPYGEDERYAMVAVLPDGDINEFIDNMDDKSFVELFTGYEEKVDANTYLPVFKVDERISLNAVLQAMGMETAFTPNANFSLIGEDLYIGKVVHRATIEVDEAGTEAAAATGVEIFGRSATMEKPWTFRADKPFIFFIYDSEQELVLFSSKVVDLN